MTDDHYQIVKDSHDLQELVMAKEQIEGDLKKAKQELQEKVHQDIFIQELDYLKSSALRRSGNSSLQSQGIDLKQQFSQVPSKRSGMTLTEKNQFKKMNETQERIHEMQKKIDQKL